jgi:DNA-binding response OmpR family regulator
MESQVGKGTTVSVVLPASADAQTANLSDVPDRTLLIDDDDPWAQFVVDALTQAGKTVKRQTGLEGVADANLILIDEALIARPVTDILTDLKAQGVTEKTIVVAAAVNVERTTAYLQTGVKDVVLKPYTPGELVTLLA